VKKRLNATHQEVKYNTLPDVQTNTASACVTVIAGKSLRNTRQIARNASGFCYRGEQCAGVGKNIYYKIVQQNIMKKDFPDFVFRRRKFLPAAIRETCPFHRWRLLPRVE